MRKAVSFLQIIDVGFNLRIEGVNQETYTISDYISLLL